MSQPVSLSITGVGVSVWKNLDPRAERSTVQASCFVTGTVSYNFEMTLSDYLTSGVTVNITPTTIAAATANAFLTSTIPARAWRLNILSGTGTVTAEVIQSGN